MSEKPYLVIHGHFYQPPREDPWTLTIENQISASPYNDWNERINAECYSANAASRILNPDGKINVILNNYEYISFNFGPTLISWIEQHDKKTYDKIIEADYKSRERHNGHGNAIAQIFNHVIITLCNDQDKRTQIIWGLYDFEKRFGRKSEGIWLSETAVNQDTLDLLIEFGIKFVILSPTQAERIRKMNSDKWQDVSDGTIDTSQPYWHISENGMIAIFFFDADISHSIAFEHLLTNAENFRHRLLSNFEKNKEWTAKHSHKTPYLINIATDGESYGHHEAFGDMCLASMINEDFHQSHFVFSNYGEFLELYPPKYEVKIKKGNNRLGTSWSCAHGVGRWMEDCGCNISHNPGWNQQWRAPLRRAFDIIRDGIAPIFVELTSQFGIKDPWEVRNHYIEMDYIQDEDKYYHFFNRFGAQDINEQNIVQLIKLFEAQRYAMYMYTSCAWFFDDVSGLEPVQNIRYAARVLEYMDEFGIDTIKKDFLEELNHAHSNIREYGTGQTIYERWVASFSLGFEEIAFHIMVHKFIINQSNQMENDQHKHLWHFNTDFQYYKEYTDNNYRIGIAKIFIKDKITLDSKTVLGILFLEDGIHLSGYFKAFTDPHLYEYLENLIQTNMEKISTKEIKSQVKDWFNKTYTIKDLRFEERQNILSILFQSIFYDMRHGTMLSVGDFIQLTQIFLNMETPLPPVIKSNLIAFVDNYLYEKSLQIKNGEDIDFNEISMVLKVAGKSGLSVCTELTCDIIRIMLLDEIRSIEEIVNQGNLPSQDQIQLLIRRVDFVNQGDMLSNRREIEDIVFNILHQRIPQQLDQLKRTDIDLSTRENLLQWVKSYLELATKLNIDVSQELELLKEERKRIKQQSIQ